MPEDEFKDGKKRKKTGTTEALKAQRKTKALLSVLCGSVVNKER